MADDAETTRFLDGITSEPFEPPRRLATEGAQRAHVSLLREAVREALPSWLRPDQTRAILDGAARRIALSSRAMTWPNPKEVLDAIRAEVEANPPDRPARRTDWRASGRDRCDPPYDGETRQMAQAFADAVRGGAALVAPYDFAVMCAVREGMLTVAEAAPWLSQGQRHRLGERHGPVGPSRTPQLRAMPKGMADFVE